MALVNGAVAKIKIGDNVVGYVSGVNLDQSADVDDIKVLGNEWTGANSNYKSWKVDIDGYLDASDAGQTAIETAYGTGADLALDIYTDAINYYSGNAKIENLKIEIKDGTTAISASLKGNGELEKN